MTMFSLSFILVLLVAFGVNSQTNDINTLQANNLAKGYPFGKLRLSEDGKNEELILSEDIAVPQPNQELSFNVQPLPSPCIGSRPSTKLAYPKDKTKYVQCRDEYHYEIFVCPNNGEYNEQTSSCDFVAPMINKCDQEKPCLNDGQCSITSNSTFKCTCRADWTGDRCEIPLNACVRKPCGPHAECRPLKTSDYEQDYVCICHGLKGYGLNCQEVVPNPCLTSEEQFYPYAFSQRAYIQCDGELVYFQPCGPSLYWSQEDKICDRKRPAKADMPTLFTKLVSNTNQQEKTVENIREDLTVTTTMQPEQQYSYTQKEKNENNGLLAFVPARIANRQQLLASMNNQQSGSTQNFREKEFNTAELSNQLLQSVDTNQVRQDFMTKTKQWPNQRFETNIRQPLTTQSGRNQLLPSNSQQQWVPTSTERSFVNSNLVETSFNSDNQQQQQSIQPQNQAFGSQQWLNQLPDMKTQTNQRLVTQPQSWQTAQNRLRAQDFSQQTPLETTTPMQNVIRLQGYQNKNSQDQEQTWQNRPTNTQLTGNQVLQTSHFLTQPQTWQDSQSSQKQQQQQQLTSSMSQATALENQNRFSTGFQPSWQTKDNNQIRQSFVQPETKSFDTQRLFLSNEQPSTSQNQQSMQTLNSESSADFHNTQLQGGSQVQNQPFGKQQRFNEVSDMKLENNQHFLAQPQSWQGSQTLENQPTVFETSTVTSNVIHLQGFQNQNLQEQEQQLRQNNIQNQPIRSQTNQVFAFRPTHWTETPKQQQQQNTFSFQSSFQPQQTLTTDSSSQISNTQSGFNQQQTGLPVQNSFEQKQSWSQAGQLNGNTFETATMPNAGIAQGLAAQNVRGRLPFRTVEQNSNNPAEQRKSLELMPATLSGSWQSRS